MICKNSTTRASRSAPCFTSCTQYLQYLTQYQTAICCNWTRLHSKELLHPLSSGWPHSLSSELDIGQQVSRTPAGGHLLLFHLVYFCLKAIREVLKTKVCPIQTSLGPLSAAGYRSAGERAPAGGPFLFFHLVSFYLKIEREVISALALASVKLLE